MVASPEKIPAELTLEIGDDLSPERFMAAARAFFGYVQALSNNSGSEGVTPNWIVRVREGSALLGVDPGPDLQPEMVQNIYTWAEAGIKHLAAGEIEESGLSESALRHLRSLSEMADASMKKGKPVSLRLWIRKKPIEIEPAIAGTIRENWRADYNDYGTLEGRLETIQESYGTLQFQLRDAMLRHKVRCYFPEQLLPEVFDTFRKRVEVSGVIHYRKDGTPISIVAERIDDLPDDADLPTAEEVRGILRG